MPGRNQEIKEIGQKLMGINRDEIKELEENRQILNRKFGVLSQIMKTENQKIQDAEKEINSLTRKFSNLSSNLGQSEINMEMIQAIPPHGDIEPFEKFTTAHIEAIQRFLQSIGVDPLDVQHNRFSFSILHEIGIEILLDEDACFCKCRISPEDSRYALQTSVISFDEMKKLMTALYEIHELENNVLLEDGHWRNYWYQYDPKNIDTYEQDHRGGEDYGDVEELVKREFNISAKTVSRGTLIFRKDDEFGNDIELLMQFINDDGERCHFLLRLAEQRSYNRFTTTSLDDPAVVRLIRHVQFIESFKWEKIEQDGRQDF
jgi:DNA repair ATPase RecN